MDLERYDYEAAEFWELQEGESTRAYEAFATFRDAGPTRTRAKTAEALSVAVATLREWAGKHSWDDRVRAYDLEIDRQHRAVLESERLQMRQRHANMAVFMQKKVAERLALMDPMELTPKDSVYMLDLSSKLERISRGEADSRVEVTGKDGGPIEVAEALSMDDRVSLMANIQQELARRLANTQPQVEAPILDAEIVDDEPGE